MNHCRFCDEEIKDSEICKISTSDGETICCKDCIEDVFSYLEKGGAEDEKLKEVPSSIKLLVNSRAIKQDDALFIWDGDKKTRFNNIKINNMRMKTGEFYYADFLTDVGYKLNPSYSYNSYNEVNPYKKIAAVAEFDLSVFLENPDLKSS